MRQIHGQYVNINQLGHETMIVALSKCVHWIPCTKNLKYQTLVKKNLLLHADIGYLHQTLIK